MVVLVLLLVRERASYEEAMGLSSVLHDVVVLLRVRTRTSCDWILPLLTKV